MRYKIYECEVKAFKNSRTGEMDEMKKLVLKEADNDQANTEPRVTLWNSHPQYNEARAGGEIEGFLEKKDSGTPIPAHPEKNFINRTLLEAEKNPNGTAKVSGNPMLESTVASLVEWAKTQGYGGTPTVEYPENNQNEPPF